MESILNSIKKLLGIAPDYKCFDTDVIIYINSALMVLADIGVSEANNFYIEDEYSTWEDLTGDIEKAGMIKTYVYLKAKLLFDPPSNGTVIESINKQISELEWRINSNVDYK